MVSAIPITLKLRGQVMTIFQIKAVFHEAHFLICDHCLSICDITAVNSMEIVVLSLFNS